MEPNTDLIIGGHDRPSSRPLAVDNIVIDESMQARSKMMAEVAVNEYADAMRQGAAFPPIDVFQDGDTYILADGYTRHAAAKRAGLTEIACRVHAGALRDAKLFAVGANAAHGHPRSAKDKRCAVLKLLNDDEWFTWSDHEIGRHCHVGHQLVAKLRPLTGRATSERRQFRSKHGTVGKMKTERIGKTHKSRKAGELGDQPGLLSPSVNKNETEITLHTAPSVENAQAAVSLIDKFAADDESQVYAGQDVGPAKALAILAEFLKFVLARIDRQDRNFVVTIVEQDATEFRCLCDRAESAIRAESGSSGNDGVVHDEPDDQADGLKLTRAEATV
jgi:hypothetical protein